MLEKVKSARLLFRLVAWAMIVSCSGMVDAAEAVTACDTNQFEGFFLAPDTKSTIAVTKQAYTWDGASAMAKAAGGRLIVVTGAEQNSAVSTNLGPFFTNISSVTSTPQAKAWIDLIDPLNSPSWSVEGGSPVVMPSRFSWADDFSSYSNWATGQPDGYCTAAEQLAHPDHNCYGEAWATINRDGTWSDEGNHSTSNVALKGVVEWPQQTLDCVAPVSEPVVTPVELLPGADTGAQYCTDATKTLMTQCVDTSNGGKFCPNDKVACNAVYESPSCPSGSTLNTTRDMCQAEPVNVCGAGYTWDSSTDRCTAAATCTDGGVLNTVTDRCEKLAMNSCPSSYVYDSNPVSPTYDKCVKPVQCSVGTFNPATDRCEAPASFNCSVAGFTLNSATGKCEKTPSCASGMTYDSAQNMCVKSVTLGCPSGYTLNSSTGRCEETPECSSGVFNAITNKCETQTTYNATLTYNCTPGDTLNGATCTASSSYPATLTGAALFDTPVYLGDFGAIYVGPNVECTSANHCYGILGYASMSNTTYSNKVAVPTSSIPSLCANYTGPLGMTLSATVLYCSYGVNYYFAPNTSNGATVPIYKNTGGGLLTTPTNNTIYGYLAAASGGIGGTYSCPSGGTLSGSTCNVTSSYSATATYTCPSGGTLSGTTCTTLTQVNPTCTNGTMDYTNHVCYASYTLTCSQGNYDSTTGLCILSPDCSGGVLNGPTDLCEASPSVDCGAQGWDSTAGVCFSSPVCSLGSYDAGLNTCVAALAKDCGSYTPVDATTCQQPPTCASDPSFSLNSSVAYASALDKCVSQTQHDCTTGTTYNGLPILKCEAVPVCANGMYQPSTDTCYNNQQSCPLGNFQCVQIAGDTTQAAPGVPMQYCSPNACQSDTSGWISDTDTESGLDDKKNDGDHGANGECLGNVYLYNGTDMRCRLRDLKGATNSYLQLGAMIALSVTGAGAALAGALGATAGSTAAAVIEATVQMAVSAAIDAATTGVDAMGVIISGVGAMAGAAAGNFAGVGANGLGDTIADSVASLGLSSGIDVMADPALSNIIQQIGNTVEQYQPEITQGLLANYSATKCCYPDKLSGACKPAEISEAKLRGNGACHVVGSYCSSKILAFCMVKKQTSCCFSSKLARIFHEQGRPQLVNFDVDGAWGSPRHPNCRGFTPAEFQSLNFGSMDLSEYIEDLNARMEQVQPLLEQYMGTFGDAQKTKLNEQFQSGVPQQ